MFQEQDEEGDDEDDEGDYDPKVSIRSVLFTFLSCFIFFLCACSSYIIGLLLLEVLYNVSGFIDAHIELIFL